MTNKVHLHWSHIKHMWFAYIHSNTPILTLFRSYSEQVLAMQRAVWLHINQTKVLFKLRKNTYVHIKTCGVCLSYSGHRDMYTPSLQYRFLLEFLQLLYCICRSLRLLQVSCLDLPFPCALVFCCWACDGVQVLSINLRCRRKTKKQCETSGKWKKNVCLCYVYVYFLWRG